MHQIEETLSGLTDRSADALEAVQHGVEALGSKLGLIEPKKQRHTARWLIIGLVLAVLAGCAVAARRRSSGAGDSAEEMSDISPMSGRRSAAAG